MNDEGQWDGLGEGLDLPINQQIPCCQRCLYRFQSYMVPRSGDTTSLQYLQYSFSDIGIAQTQNTGKINTILIENCTKIIVLSTCITMWCPSCLKTQIILEGPPLVRFSQPLLQRCN